MRPQTATHAGPSARLREPLPGTWLYEGAGAGRPEGPFASVEDALAHLRARHPGATALELVPHDPARPEDPALIRLARLEGAGRPRGAAPTPPSVGPAAPRRRGRSPAARLADRSGETCALVGQGIDPRSAEELVDDVLAARHRLARAGRLALWSRARAAWAIWRDLTLLTHRW